MSSSSSVASTTSTTSSSSASSKASSTTYLGDRKVSASSSLSSTSLPSIGTAASVASGCIEGMQSGASFLQKVILFPKEIKSKLPYLHALSIPLIPFQLISLGKDMLAVSAADSFKRFGRRVLEVVANTSDLISSVISAINFLHFLKVVRNIQFLPILDIILIPVNAVKTVLDLWDTFKLTHTFIVITKQKSRPIETTEQAKEALQALKAHGIRKIGAHLGTSKDSLEEKVNQLFEKVNSGNMDAMAIIETQQLLDTLKSRVNIKLGLTVAKTALNIATLAGSILTLAVPAAPVVGVVISSVSATASLAISAGETLFLTEDILDPNSKNKVTQIVDKVTSVYNYIRGDTPLVTA